MTMQVAVLGISSNPARYAHRAAVRLLGARHEVFGVNPRLPEVPGVRVVDDVSQLPPGIHTLTVYVGAPTSTSAAKAIAGYGFSRVIFNPGAENSQLQQQLSEAGVEVVEDCTLVMLSTQRF